MKRERGVREEGSKEGGKEGRQEEEKTVLGD